MKRAWALFKSHPYVSNVVGYTSLFATADLIQQIMLGGKREQTDLHKGNIFGHDTADEGTAVTRREGSHENEWESLGSKKWKVQLSVAERSKRGLGETGVTPDVKKLPPLGIDLTQTARVALVGFCFHANFNYQWLKALERMWPGGGARRVAVKVVSDQLVAAPATISAFYIGLSALEGREDPLEDWREKFWTSYKTGVVYWSTMQAVNFSLVPPVARTVFVGGITLVWTVFLCHFRQQRADTQTQSSTH